MYIDVEKFVLAVPTPVTIRMQYLQFIARIHENNVATGLEKMFVNCEQFLLSITRLHL